MEKKFEVLPPMMPNFARFKRHDAFRKDSSKSDDVFPISQFTKQEAEEYAELMKKTFMQHWEAKRKIS